MKPSVHRKLFGQVLSGTSLTLSLVDGIQDVFTALKKPFKLGFTVFTTCWEAKHSGRLKFLDRPMFEVPTAF